MPRKKGRFFFPEFYYYQYLFIVAKGNLSNFVLRVNNETAAIEL